MSDWSRIAVIRRRLGRESGTLRSQAGFRVALCYPSPYRIGMSSLGYQAIYREIHLHPGASAERAFLPDDPSGGREPLLTYENEMPVGEFPMVAFSISYELELTGIFDMLAAAGIPLLRRERTGRHPLIVAGGPLTNSNPLPLAPFVDVVVLGEGEELVHVLLDAAVSLEREELLSHLAAREGFYVPDRSRVLPPLARADDGRLPARSQILTDDTVLSSMFLVEAARGCSRGCRYCVMRRTTHGGMRLVPREAILELIPAEARRVGLVGAAVTDHPRIREIVRAVVDGGREIGISSLRVDRLDEELVGSLARGGYRTLTTAADGSSQRLRDAVDRNVKEEHFLRAAELVRRFGLKQLKIYVMVGLPGEAAADIDELARFSIELARTAPVSLAISPFVAKRNTPLDGRPYEPIRSIEEKLARLRGRLKGKVGMRSTSARWGWVEYMLSQGDERAGSAALEAWRGGGGFQAWKRAFERSETGTGTSAGKEINSGTRCNAASERRL